MARRAGLFLLGALLLLPLRVGAEDHKNKGLFITPLRAYPVVSPGKQANGTFTVANITEESTVIDLSIEQFSVTDYTYDYQFNHTQKDWLRLNKTQLKLQPNKSETLTYAITPPSDVTPGGHYFTIFATTQPQHSTNKVRAAIVLYITVDGEIRKTSQVDQHSILPVSLGSDLSFSLNVKNTGNTHFFTYTTGELQGLSAKSERRETTNLLLPGKPRVLNGTIPAPLLPGVYRAVYGYRTDDGQQIKREAFIWYIPPWSVLIPAGVAWLFLAIRRRRKRD